MLGFGWHVNMQKPTCNDLSGAQRMLEAAKANGRILRVMENYLFYEPLRKAVRDMRGSIAAPAAASSSPASRSTPTA